MALVTDLCLEIYSTVIYLRPILKMAVLDICGMNTYSLQECSLTSLKS